jgi:ComF family protein
MSVFDTLADAIFPPTCGGCQKTGSWLCKNCILKLQPTTPECISCRRLSPAYKTHEYCNSNMDRSIIAWRYSDISRKIVKRFKYQMSYVSIRPILEQLDKIILNNLKNFSGVVVPVPLHPQRERDRGFNQSEIVGKYIAKVLGIPIRTDLIRRSRYTDSQALKNEIERRNNLKDAFQLIKEIPSEVLLVDDVITTGSTVEEISKTLGTSVTAFALFRPPINKV